VLFRSRRNANPVAVQASLVAEAVAVAAALRKQGNSTKDNITAAHTVVTKLRSIKLKRIFPKYMYEVKYTALVTQRAFI